MGSISLSFLDSEQYTFVRRRIFRQLIESLIYEGIIQTSDLVPQGDNQFALLGHDSEGAEVTYRFHAEKKFSFERIRLSDDPVKRMVHGEEYEAESISTFLLEIAPLISTTEDKLSLFIDEIYQTLLKDTLAQFERATQPKQQEIDYDELEGDIMDGHPYHPCYKSRIGFNLEDHKAFGPEFKPHLQLIWVAIHKSETKLSTISSLQYDTFIQQELDLDYLSFVTKIEAAGRDSDDYVFVPVHPWQWRQIIASEFFEAIRNKRIIYLGEGKDEYRPQQSIRTLSNFTVPSKAYVKTPLSITNTSTSRILAQHTIINAARISDWLGEIVANDSYLCEELKVVLLREIAGASYHHQGLDNLMEQKVYGVLGVIWRESLHSFLKAEETAIPFNGLCHVDTKNQPLIDPWIQKLGVQNWLSQLFKVSILPLIHLLYAYGVALEAHAQNMILIMKEGIPVRVALKDFHDGIRYSPTAVPKQIGYPQVEYPPANHPRLNRNSFIEKENVVEVKDFFHDAFFFINLSELALFLEKHYGFSEQDFWKIAADVIISYQKQFPQYQDRFEMFDLFSETIEVEQLTKRRLFAEDGDRVHIVKNPLHAFQA